MKMIKEEFKQIFQNKVLLVVSIVLIFIPLLYAVFFLTSVWDPYGETSKLPVAVVNQDQSVKYKGHKMAVGKQLTTNLKKNNDLDWHFVSSNKAKQGLKKHKYYTVITIPKNFSSNATTVTNRHPKKMHLKYSTNASMNYIAKVISEAGAKQLNAQVRSAVTKAYATAIFKQIKTAGHGYAKAANGAKQLKNGSVELTDGLHTYTTGVHTLKNGLDEFTVSVKPLKSGIGQLANGSQQLTTGLDSLNTKTGQLSTGVNQLFTGSNAVSNGLSQINSQSGQLQSGVGQLADGSRSLASGVNQYTTGVASLNSGLQQLNQQTQQAGGGVGQLTTAAQTLSTNAQKLNQASGQITTALQSGASGTSNQIKTLTANLNQLEKDVQTSGNTADQSQISYLLGDLQSQTAKLSQNDSSSPTNSSQTNQVIDQKIDTVAQQQNLTAEQVAALKSSLSGVGSSTTTNSNDNQEAVLSHASSDVKQLQSLMNQQTDQAQETSRVSDDLVATKTSAQKLTSSAQQLGALTTSSARVTSGLAQLANGTATFAQAITQVGQKAGQLETAIATLANGSKQLTQNSGQLTNGATQLATGTDQLTTKLPSLVLGLAKLGLGSNQLTSGLGQMVGQMPTLSTGVTQLDHGGQNLNKGIGQLSGSSDKLIQGTQKLDTGANKLDHNSMQLVSGSTKLINGSGKLQGSLSAGAKKIRKTPLKKSNAKMFAAPSVLKHHNYSYVPNYGNALAPYVLSLALFVGAIVFNFAYPIRRMAIEGESARHWFISKMAVATSVAVLMAVAEETMLIIVGIRPDHLAEYYLTGILISLASMYIVFFLSFAFDNPGRFGAMLLLMLQLGGSGGTFPMEVTNHFFNVIHPYLPMSYSVMAFRQAITSGIGQVYYWQYLRSLLIFIIIALVLIYGAMIILRDMHLQTPKRTTINSK